MTSELEIGLYIFILAGFLGYHLITRVPPLLHTPLMSSTNVFGGFLITDRMLKMFKKGGEEHAQRRWREFNPKLLLAFPVLVVVFLVLFHSFRQPGGARALAAHALRYFYILSAVLFILGLKGLSSPKWARKGMFLAAFGMLMAIVGTLFHPEIVNY